MDHHRDNDIDDKKRKRNKRKRGAADNPLAVARGSFNKKKQHKAESLWHRRSGIGYRLFVEYYRQQPVGVVVGVAAAVSAAAAAFDNNNNGRHCHDDDDTADDKKNSTTSAFKQTTTTLATGGGGGAGQSRAAKRRKKKQEQKDSFPMTNKETELVSTTCTATTTTTTTASSSQVVPAAATILARPSSISICEDDSNYNHHPLLEALRQDDHHLYKRKGQQQDHDHDHHDSYALFEEFLVALSKPLPLTFRIRNGISSSVHQELTTFIQQHFSQLVSPMPWNDQIYQAKLLKTATTRAVSTSSSTSSSKISKSSILSRSNLSQVSPLLKEFLQKHSVDGTLARQEVGSMLPVLGLHRGGWLSTTTTTPTTASDSSSNNTKTSFRVLDMCASPGSKTLQLLELLQQQPQQQQQQTSTIRNNNNNIQPPRIIIKANDINATRLETLRQVVERANVLQTRKQQNNVNSSSSSISSTIIKYTNFDASQYPIPTMLPSSNKKKAYNVILCDVPCSGDGTIRKDGHILPNWTPATSHALHQLQVNILYRALSCLQAPSANNAGSSSSSSSVVSYSTCSLNPIENEAVVAAAILKARQTGLQQRGHGQQRNAVNTANTNTTATMATNNTNNNKSPARPIVELVDWPEMASSGFIRRPGVCSWRVADYVGDAVDEDDDDHNTKNHHDHDDHHNANKMHRAPSAGKNDCQQEPIKRQGGGPLLLRWHATYKDAVQAQMEHAVPSMWPPPEEVVEVEDDDSLHLERCVRLLPQDHDTGGFFVALIKRNF